MEMSPPPPILKRVNGSSDLLSLVKPKAQGVADSENLPVFTALTPWDVLFEKWDSVRTLEDVSMTGASISPAAPVSVHDHHWDFSIVDNSTTVMTEPSSWLSLGREAPPLSPSIPVVEGDIPSMNSGRGPSSSPEVPTIEDAFTEIQQ